MLFNAYRVFPYAAQHFAYTTITSADGTVTTREYSLSPEQINIAISTSFVGDLIIITRSKLQKGARLRNIVDRNGNQVYQNALWEITQTMPRTNPIGFVEGYKYKAKIISGDI